MKERACTAVVLLWISVVAAAAVEPIAPYPAEREAVIVREPAGRRAVSGRSGTPFTQELPDGSRLVLIPRVDAGTGTVAAPSGARPAGTRDFGARWRRDGGAHVAVVGGQDVFAFHEDTVPPPRPDIDPVFARSGFIDGIRTRSGLVVSQAFPRLPVNHEHLYGLWSAWTATEFEGRAMNFWDVKGGTGRIRCEEVSGLWDGMLAAGLTAVNVYYDRTVAPERAALRETWRVVSYALPDEFAYRLFDVSLHQVCATASPVRLKEYRYSGFAMRYPDAFYGDAALFMVASGETDRVKANHTRQRWVYMGGLLDGRQGGVALLSHPANFRAPEMVRLHPKTPFFCFSPSSAGDWEITPNQPYRAHYRVVVLDGPPDRAQLDRLWHAFASVPPAAAPEVALPPTPAGR